MKQMTIVYIITKLELGGAQKICISLFNNLPAESYNSFLISGSNGYLYQSVAKNSHLITLPALEREFKWYNPFKEVTAFIELTRTLRHLKQTQPELIVHTHSTKAGIIGRWAAWCAGITTRVHTVHGYAFHPHQSNIIWFCIYLIELITSFITTQFICVSTHDIRIGNKLFPFFKNKYRLIRAAVDTTQFTSATTQPNPSKLFTFGTIACFKPQKNLLDLLNAFKHVHTIHPNTRLEIIGDGLLRGRIEQFINQHNLTHAIILHGWHTEVAPLMRTWNVFTLSSLWEGLPCAIVEARLLGLPVVAYNTGGISDIIISGKNGLLAEQKNIAQLSSYMCRMYQDQDLYTACRTYQDNLCNFDTAQMVQHHVQLYTHIHQSQ